MAIGTTAAILAGLGAAGGALSNRSKTSTSSQTTTPTLDPLLQPLQGAAIEEILRRMRSPGAGLQPLKTAAIDNINKTYSALPQRLTEQFASRGLNNSGLLGKSLQQAELGRAGEVAGLEGKFAGLELDQQSEIMRQILALLSQGRGSTTNATGTTPGNMLGGAFSGGVDGILAAMALNRSSGGKPPLPGMTYGTGQYGPGWYRES